MKPSERDALDRALARKLLRLTQPVVLNKLATPTTPGGGDDDLRDFDAFDNPMEDIADLIVGGESGAPTRLPPGTDGQVLTVQPDLTLAWETPGVGTSYTDEDARDAIGAALVAGTGITITISDLGNTITIEATGATSGKYQNYIYELDGVGGFDWITDDDGNPMYVLADLE